MIEPLAGPFHSERLFIRLLSPEEVDDRMLAWHQNGESMQFYTGSGRLFGRADIERHIRTGLEAKSYFIYGIHMSDTGLRIGTVKIGPIDWKNRIADLVALIGDRAFLAKGLAAEAIRLAGNVAFEHYDMRKLFGGMHESNASSIKAYTRAGWVIEGRLKGHYLNDGRPEDRVLVGCFNPKYFPDWQEPD